jgi:CxxC motif-containing protein
MNDVKEDVRELICVNCPMGCRLQVTVEQGQVRTVKGNVCARGDRYARDEVLQPRRMVTSLITIAGSREPLSVKTHAAIPKDQIFACLREIRRCKVSLPVKIGDVILENVAGTGINIVATRNLPDPPYNATSQDNGNPM